MENLRVESYAGSRAAEHPLRFYINRRRIEIVTIADSWLTPEARFFKVLGDDGYLYLLKHSEAEDAWNLLTRDRP